MGTQRVQMKGGWACRAGTIDFCHVMAFQVGPVQNIFFLAVHFFNSFVSIAHQAGQAVLQGRLSFYVCLWYILELFPFPYLSTGCLSSRA